MEYEKIKEQLLLASDNQLDASMKPYIEKWGNPPSVLEILEVLDYCAHASLASQFVMTVLNILLESACKDENIKQEDLVQFAIWRKKM